ncbi:Adenine nucleotide alpha hydrolases-like protein [Dioscorea alata]|uniref:Adenine nucleotide alpha hydrolases-like protein n=1 Tax=Dioscorea alata TaxID=55571 RepID=A0ACB7WI40_DIOAL|nr:Adenine nucleotide alpha hydrolases-like protein [Dioscorea alata]
MEDVGMPLVAVAVDKDKGSQNALKWALENLVQKGQTITLVHVRTTKSNTSQSPEELAGGYKTPADQQTKEIFLPFRCYCTRKDVNCKDVVLEDIDIPKAIVEFAAHAALEKLVVGAPSKSGFVRRFKSSDKASSICKGAPDFCSVYVIAKGKVSSERHAIRAAPAISPLRTQIQSQASSIQRPDSTDVINVRPPRDAAVFPGVADVHSLRDESIRSPFTRGSYKTSSRSMADSSFTSESDISFVSSGRPSVDRGFTPRMSVGSDRSSIDIMRTPHRWMDSSYSSGSEFSSITQDTTGTSWSSHAVDDVEAEMRRLRLELKQTMDMYSSACKEALTAKQQAMELNKWKMAEEQKLEAARNSEERAKALAEREQAKSKAALEAAEASQRIAELEAQKRMNAELKVLQESQERKSSLVDSSSYSDVRYRKYTIEEIETATEFFAGKRKIGEGGYGPVFRCYLDHTQVAIKVLRPDAAQGKTQFQQEVFTTIKNVKNHTQDWHIPNISNSNYYY